MPGIKTSTLDTRLFRCAAYMWTVSIERTLTMPPEDPIFNGPEDAAAYLARVKRNYTVIDENVSGYKEKFTDFKVAWSDFCRVVHGYAKHFPQLTKQPGEELYRLRYDLPDPTREET